MKDVDLILPTLKGSNIDEHFFNIAKDQVHQYESLVSSIVSANIPQMPEVEPEIL